MTNAINRADRRRLFVPGGICSWLGLLLVVLAATVPAEGERMFLGRRGFIEDGGGDSGKQAQVAEFPDGATLPTDSEADRVLKRAQEYVAEGRFDLAVVVWQDVLNRTTTAMRSTDGQYYTSVQNYVEEQLDRLARTAPDGLKEYRVKADGEARALIAQAKGLDEEKALSDVVRRYFYSSLGDDAAYTLGCLMLDRFEFVAAARQFANILTRHPDYIAKTDTAPNLSRSELWLRLAVATARTGDAVSAKVAIAEHAKLGNTQGAADVLAWVNHMIAGGGGGVEIVGTPPGEWLMNHGSPLHDGRMTGLPRDTKYTGVWQEKWITRFSDGGYGLNAPQGPVATSPQPLIMVGAMRSSRAVMPAAAQPMGYDARRRATAKKWESSDWLPTDTLLMHAGRVYIRAYDRVICVDGRTGKSMFSYRRVIPQVRPQQPSSAEEVLLFGDRASNTMTIADGSLYYIEEDNTSTLQSSNNNSVHRNRAGLTAFRPMVPTKIVALDARNGKLKWETQPEADEKGVRHAVRYQGAPVPYGNLLLAPVIDNGGVWLYAHRADKNGELAWKTILADEPPGGYNPWATTGLSIAGGDAYLVSGGVVFNVDATGGLIRWAVRYNRNLDGSTRVNPNYGNQQSPIAKGWEDDVLIPYGGSLIVMANDRDAIMALDRSTGRKQWEIEREGATHVLGVSGRYMYVASRGNISKYDLVTGSLKTRTEVDRAITGRGFIAEDALYIPMGNAVVRFHPTTLKRLSAVGVALPINDSDGKFDYNDPLGNLFSDGQRLYGVGLERVYALGAIERAKADPAIDPAKPGAELPPSVSLRKESTGDINVDILLDHGVEPTAASLAKYLGDLHPSAETKKHVDLTIRQLGDDDYSKRKAAQIELLSMPVVPVEAIVAAMEHSTDAEVRDAAARIFAATDGKRARVLYAALSTIRKKEIKGLAAPTLAAIPLCTQQHLLDAAGLALKTTATEADGEVLRKGAADKSAEVRVVAAGAIGVALKEKGQADLRILAKDSDERVRLAAARALANQGDRGSLDLLAALLESDNVYTRGASARALRAFTGQQIEFVSYDDAEKRKAAVANWKTWIATHGKTAKLTFPLSDVRMQLGRTLIANYRTGLVYEIDASGSQTWTTTVQNCWGVLGLPNGHRLVSSYTLRNVVEFDEKGEKVWEQKDLPSAPFSIERLENGNTLIACSNSNRIVEVDAANKVVWDVTVMGRPTEARRLPNGRTLVALQNGNRIVEVNSEGKEEWKIDNLGAPLSAQRLANGNTIVAEVSGNRVREFDADGKEVWSLATMAGRNVQTPYYAERLENGNTLVADATGIREVTAKGDVVNEKLDQGVSRVSKY